MAKADAATVEFQTRVNNLLKAELRRRGITYADLAEILARIGFTDNKRNLNDKTSRSGFNAAFLLQCLIAIGSKDLRLD